MRDAGLLALPFVGLVALALVGAGVAAALAPRLPLDALTALCPLVGAASMATASVLLPLGVPAKPLAVAVASACVLVTIALRARVVPALRAGFAPLAVAVAAILLAATPALANGSGEVTSLYDSTDAYHWSSQARAYLDGPADRPVSEHPDRLTYERTQTQHWAVAVPFGLLEAAWLARSDPESSYAGFAALVFALLPLATFACARGCLEWPSRAAVAAALAVAVNAALLFASHFSWQQQTAGAAFALAAAALLRLALEDRGPLGEAVLAALFAAAALGSYRLGFAPFLAALLAVVAVAYAWTRRREPARIVPGAAAFALAFAALAAPSLVALARGLPDFVSEGGFSTAFKRGFPDGHPAEALGLVPRVWAIEERWDAALRITWVTVASIVAAGLLVAGIRTLRRSRAPRLDFLAAGTALALVGYLVLLLPPFASYLSFKLLSYTSPFLVLVALSPLALAQGRTRLVTATAFAMLALPSAAVATSAAARAARPPGPILGVGAAAKALPRDATISVELDDPWEQAWALYALRDHRLSVERPSFLLTGQGAKLSAAAFRHGPVAYVLGRGVSGRALWRADGLALVRR